MKHPKSNLCVDFIVEYSKTKSWSDQEKVCRRYEDVLFAHFEDPDGVTEKEKRSDLNLLVAMTMFGYHPIFLGDYALQICESNKELKNECYIALAAMENLGTVFDEKIQLFIWSDFLTAESEGPALNYMAQTKADWANAMHEQSSRAVNDVLRKLTEMMFIPSAPTRVKLLALKALMNFCNVLDPSKTLELLLDIQGKCTDDDTLFACCEKIPGLIEFVCDLIHRCSVAKGNAGGALEINYAFIYLFQQ